MADKAWKRREREAAALFGSRRNVLSGSSGRDDRTASDSTHPTLFLEVKHRATHTVGTLYRKTKTLAKREGKTPVLILSETNRPGFLVVIHSDDWEVLRRDGMRS